MGSTPAALAVSSDGSKLYVALAALNAIAVVDTAKSEVLGMIPTAWYPAGVQISTDNSKLYLASLKGMGARATDLNLPVAGQQHVEKSRGYNSHDDTGTISVIPVPSNAELTAYTATVARNTSLPEMRATLLPRASSTRVVPVPTAPGDVSPIKHVVYILKENRTYDSVFDMAQGNGDPSLCLFPELCLPIIMR